MTDYTKTTDFTSKDSLPSGDSGKIIRGAEFGTEFDNIETAVNSKSNIENPSFTGNITVTGTVDGRDIAADGTKLDTIETSADVTDTANVTAAGAVMDSELTNITAVKALNQGVATTDSPTFAAVTSTGNVTVGGTVDGRDVAADGTKLDGIEAGATADQTPAQIKTAYESNANTNAFTDADHTKLDGIEASADVTDTTNVTAAGALMDSELTDIAAVKALNQGVATTDSPTFAGATVNGTVEFDGLSGTGAVTVTDILDQDNMSSNSATALATQQSIKSYVDSQVATSDTLAEVLANGNTTGGTDVAFGDNDKAIFGAGSDLQIYHSGTTSFITENGTGDLRISGNNLLLRSDDIFVQSEDGTANAARFNSSTGVTLYRAGAAKLNTTSTGIDVTGTVTADGLTVDSGGTLRLNASSTTDFFTIAQGGTQAVLTADSPDGAANMVFRTASAGVDTDRLSISSNGDMALYEDTGTTAKFFWDASAEYLGIGTGSPTNPLNVVVPDNSGIQIESAASHKGYLFFGDDASNTVGRIGYDHATDAMDFWTGSGSRMTVDSTGIDVSGTVTADGLTVTGTLGNWSIDPQGVIQDFTRNSTNYIRASDSAGNLMFQTGGGNHRLFIANNGDVSLYEDTGTTAKLFWDASAESLGIGTSDPSETLTVSGNIQIEDNDGYLQFKDTNGGTDNKFRRIYNSEQALFISRRNDDGTLEANDLIIDSSGNVGIGTDSPASNLEISDSTQSTGATLSITNSHEGAWTSGDKIGSIDFRIDDGSTPQKVRSRIHTEGKTTGTFPFASELVFSTANADVLSEAMRIDASGNVGIGTDSPANTQGGLDAAGAILARGSVAANQTSAGGFDMSGNGLRIRSWGATAGTGVIDFRTGGGGGSVDSQAMRIDSSQNLLVGKTASNTGVAGAELRANGFNAFCRDGGEVMNINRLTSDGTIIDFRKDSSTVGTIGTVGGDAYFEHGGTGIRLWDGNLAITPCGTSGATLDGTRNLGASSARFKDLYLSGGAYLGGTAAANKLDDYEEGTWTPELADATTGGNTATIASADGTYTKVGRLVTVGCRLHDIDTSGMTGANALYIRGLPFTTSATTRTQIGSVLFDRISFSGFVVAFAVNSNPYVLLYKNVSGAQDAALAVSDITTTGSDINFTLQYEV